MITVCPGWTVRHEPAVVLKPENGDQPGKVSHGMCAECFAEADRQLTVAEEKAAAK